MSEIVRLLLGLVILLGFAFLGLLCFLDPKKGIRLLEWWSGVEQWPESIFQSWLFSRFYWRVGGFALVVMAGYLIHGIILSLTRLVVQGLPPSSQSSGETNWLPLAISVVMISAGIYSLARPSAAANLASRMIPGRVPPEESVKRSRFMVRNLGIWLILAGIVAFVAWLNNS